MATLWFVRQVPQVEKASSRTTEIKGSAIALIGGMTAVLVGLAIALYAMNQPEPARLVIDLAIGFFAWSSGRTAGEKAGIEQS